MPLPASHPPPQHAVRSINPEVGSRTSTYRITVSNLPVEPNDGFLEVRVDVRGLRTHTGTIFFAFVVPGETQFSIDYNEPEGGLARDRYLVHVRTPHIHGACAAVGRFRVV